MKRFLVLALALSSAIPAVSPAFAQPATTPPGTPPGVQPPPVPTAGDSIDAELDALVVGDGLTADAAAGQAAGASPAVQRRAAEIESAIEQLETTKLARIPLVSVEASYTRLSRVEGTSFELVPGMPFVIAFPSNSFVTRATLAVPLSDYVFRSPRGIEAAELGITAARLGEKTSGVDASYQARLAYYEWVRSRLQVMVAQRQLIQVRATLGQVRALAEAQRVSRADLLRVESQEAQADQAAVQLGQLVELREEQLRLLVGAKSGQRLAIGEDIRKEVAPPSSTSLDELVGLAQRQRLEFRAIDTGIQAKSVARRAEQAKFYPRVSAFASADYANPNQRIFPLVEEFRFTWQAGVQLQWNLNDALVARSSRRRIVAEENALKADRENLTRGTRIQILAAQQALLVAEHSLATSQKGLAAAEEAYRVRQALLAAQRATAVELVDAETELTRARIAALNSRIDLRVALAQLAYATGETSKSVR